MSAGADVLTGGAGQQTGSASEPQNLGSARSDYGDLAYGGRLNEQGLEPGAHSSSPATSTGTGGGGMGTAWMLLVGMGLGAGLMYILDPDKGGRRRALLRDKLVAFSNDAADLVESKSRHLRNKAQGVIAEASSLFKSNNEEQNQDETQPAQGGETSQA